MSLKQVTDLSFNEAQEQALNYISQLTFFVEEISRIFQVSPECEKILQNLGKMVRETSCRCLIQYDILLLDDFAQKLIIANPDTTKQLSLFWNIYEALFQALKLRPDLGAFAPRNIMMKNWVEIRNTDSLTEILVKESESKPTQVAFPLGFLLAYVLRVETADEAIRDQLQEVIDTLRKCGINDYTRNERERIHCIYDVFLSEKSKNIDSDVRVIRNAIAHGCFNLKEGLDGYNIELWNDDYTFYRIFTQREFKKFYDLYTLLYKRQLALLIILELRSILTAHFLIRL